MQKKLVVYLYLFIGMLIFLGCSNELIQPAPILNETKVDAAIVQHDLKHPKMKVHYIDVGQADATLLQFDDEEPLTMLIDTGDWGSSDVVAYLYSQNVKDINIIAITHPHADHIGQLDKIIDAFNVDEVWMNGETVNSQVFARSLEAIENKGIEYYEPEVGDVFDIGPLEVEVLHPNSLSMGTNSNSLTLRLQYGEVSFLFTGDAEQQAENDMLSRGVNLSATILHMGHHGSNTSTIPEFLKAVNPEIAIYSAGANNSYGHPDVEVITRVQSSGALVYGTDLNGTIIVETDGNKYNVLTDKQGTLSDPSSDESCVNINSASEEEVQQIMHIGSALAVELIELRPYLSIDELVKINGIGPARIKDIQMQGIACIGG